MEIHANIDDKCGKKLEKQLGMNKIEMTRLAFTILNWAADQTANNRAIYSGSNGIYLRELALPGLDAIRPKREIKSERE